jgi:hypothetical protein
MVEQSLEVNARTEMFRPQSGFKIRSHAENPTPLSKNPDLEKKDKLIKKLAKSNSKMFEKVYRGPK